MTLTEGTDKLAVALLRPINPALVILLGAFTVVWGFWVGNPFWTVFTQADLYSQLSALAPEWFWGSLAVFCGLITCYGAWKRSYRPLVRGAAISGWHWLMISIFYFIGDPLNTGGITAAVFAIYSACVYLNIRVNHKNNKKDPEILH